MVRQCRVHVFKKILCSLNKYFVICLLTNPCCDSEYDWKACIMILFFFFLFFQDEDLVSISWQVKKNGLLWKDSKLGVVSFVELESLLDFGTNAKQSWQSAVLMKCRPTRILLVLLSSQLKEGSGLILLQQGLPMRECWLTSSTAFWVKRLEPPGAQDLEQLEPEFKGLPRKQV